MLWAWIPVILVVGYALARRRTAPWRAAGVLFLTSYVFWIASVAFFPIPKGGWGFSLSEINLIPIREMVRIIPRQSAWQIVREHGGNFLLLVPFTLLGPILWPRLRAWRWALAIGLGGSIAIEAVQLVLCLVVDNPYRYVDIDDVIVNTAGALFGYALFLAGRRAVAALRRRRRARRS